MVSSESNTVNVAHVFNQIYQNLPIPAAVWGFKGKLISYNDAFLKLFSYSQDELLSKEFTELIILTDDTNKLLKSVTQGEKFQSLHGFAMVFDDNPSAGAVSLFPLIEQDKIIGIISVITVLPHVPQDKDVQRLNLLEAYEMYKSLSESALIGVYVYSEGRFLYVNKHMSRITGYSINELTSMHTGDIVASEDRENLENIITERKNFVNTSHSYSFKIIRKDGSQAYVEVYTRTITYKGQPARLGHCIDVTDKVQAQVRMRASEELSTSTINSLEDAICVVDRNMNILIHNSAMSRWIENLGMKLERDIVGMNLFGVFPFLDSKIKKEEYNKVWRTGEPLFTTEENIFSEKLVVTETKKIPVKDENNEVTRIVTVIRDITQKKYTEELLKSEREAFSIIAKASVLAVDVPGICNKVLEGLVKILNFDTGSVQLYNQANNTLVLKAMTGIWGDGPIEESTPIQAIDDEKYLATYVARTKEYVFAPDVSKHSLYARFKNRFAVSRIKAIISWPITGSRGQLLGVIHLAGKEAMQIPKQNKRFFELVIRMFSTVLERKLAEESLRELEEKYCILFQGLTDAVLIYDLEGVIIDVNELTLSLFECSREDIVGSRIMEIHPEYEIEKLKASFEEIKKRGVASFEMEFLKKTGKVFPAEVSSSLIEIGGKKVIQGIVRDVTERNLLELQRRIKVSLLNDLREANSHEACLQLGVQAIRDAGLFKKVLMILLNNDEEKIAFVGQIGLKKQEFEEMRRIVSSSKRLFLQTFPKECRISNSFFIPCELGEVLIENYNHAIQPEESLHISADWQSDDKLFVPMLGSDGSIEGYLLVDAPFNGKRPGREVVVYLEDIVDVVIRQIRDLRSMNAILKSEKRYRILFENADDAIFLMKDGAFIDCNSKTFDLFGYKKEELIGKAPYEFSPLLQPDGLLSEQKAQKLINKVYNGFTQRFYWKHLRRDGTTFDAEVSLNRLEFSEEVMILAIVRDITERKRVEEALRESEEFSRAVIERSPLAVSVRGKTGKLLSVNDSWCRIWGIPHEALLEDLTRERSEFQFDSTDSYLGKWQAEIKKIYSEGGYLHIPELEIKNPRPGAARWISHHFYAIKDAAGEVNRVVILTEDITNRINTAAALEESEEKYRNLVERANDGIVIVQDGLLKYLNPRLAEMLDYSVEETLDTEFHRYISPADLSAVQGRYKRRLDGEDLESVYEVVLVAKNGRKVYVELNAGRIAFQGRPADLVLIRDITERKFAEETLREREELYRTLVNSADEGIGLLDINEKFIYVNPKMSELLGYSQEDLIGLSFLELVVPEDVEVIQNETIKRLRGEASRYEISMIHRDGTLRNLLVTAAPIFDSSGNFSATLGVLTDITELKKVENELRLRLIYQTALTQVMNKSIAIDSFDDFMRDCLEILGSTSGVSRVYFAKNHAQGKKFAFLNQWVDKGCYRMPENAFLFDDIPYVKERLLSDEVVALEISSLPPEDKKVFEKGSALSMLIAPLFLRNGFFGFIGMDECIAHRQWNTIEVEAFKTIVRIIGTVIDRYFEEQERLLAEEALAESEQRYRTLVETSEDIIFLLSPTGQLLYVSSAIAKLGFTSEELIGTLPDSFINKMPRDEMVMMGAIFSKSLREKYAVQEVDCEVFDANGKRHWLAISWNWIKDDRGNVMAAQGVAREITERKEAEESLRLSMSYEKALFELSSQFLSEGISNDTASEFLSRLGQVTNVSSVYLFTNRDGDEGKVFMINKHWWLRKEEQIEGEFPEKICYADGFERWFEKLSTGVHIQGLVKDFPSSEREYYADRGVLSVLILPIFVEGKFWGGIGFEELKREREWTLEEMRLLWTASQIFSSALATDIKSRQLAKSYEELQDRESQIIALNVKLVQIEEQERRRIARVLHDEIAQQLTGVSLLLSTPELNALQKEKANLEDAKQMVMETQKFIRDLSYELRPPALDNLGLGAAVRALGKSVAEGMGISFVIRGEDTIPRADSDTEIMLYRIIQESVNNAIKHADADEIEIVFAYEQNRLMISIKDDGEGFDVSETLAKSQGLGLNSMRERVALIGGEMKIESTLGKGTELRIELEIDRELGKLPQEET